MKKYFVILALLAFIQAQAKDRYPKTHVDTLKEVVYPNDSVAIITTKKVITVIDSAITVPYHGMMITSSIKERIDTILLSVRTIKISRAVLSKFDGTGTIGNYLLNGFQSPDRDECVVSIVHGAITKHYFLYIKNDVLLYKTNTTRGLSVLMILYAVIILGATILWDGFTCGTTAETMLRWDNILFGVVFGSVLPFVVLSNSLLRWDELVTPPILSIVLYFGVMVIKKISGNTESNLLQPRFGGGGGN